MASSVGFRRAVVNPYVMDKETVDRLSESFLSSPESRSLTAAWLKGLSGLLPVELPVDKKVVALWGDSDPLYPVESLPQSGSMELLPIPGGRFMHPQERPWEMADACTELLEKSGI